jgi:ParB family chromosome partitioning protein
MSLVENLARLRASPEELVRELRVQRERGASNTEIAKNIGVSDSYVTMLFRLIDNGEERLLRSVERGEIPINVAIDIAGCDDAAIQQSLAEAYTSKQLRGKALLAARRLVEQRRVRGKGMKSAARREKPKMTAEELVRTYKRETQRQKRLVKLARMTELRLVFLSNALKRLLNDEHFVTLLRAEKLDMMPEYLAAAIKRAA